MGTPTASFAINLKDETSGAAKSAASALSDLKGSIDDDIKSLREMQKALRNLKGGTSTSSEGFKKLKDQIKAQKASIASAQSKYIDLGGTFGKTGVKATTLSESLTGLSTRLSGSSGAVGTLGAGLTRLVPLLTNPITLVLALTAAMLAFAASVGVAVLALGRYALAQSNARRNELLRLQGFTTLRNEFGRVRASAEGMQAAIDRATDATGIGRGQAEGYARSFARVGFQGEALAQAMEGVSLAAQVQGERGARRFRALAMQTALTGGSIEALTERYRATLGPIARRTMLSLENQTARLQQGLQRIFSGVRIEAFLGAIDNITRSFSQTTATGRALKSIIEALFNPIFDATETLGPVLRRFFQGMVIGALLITLGFLRLRSAFRRAFGNETILSQQSMMNVALAAGVVVVGLFAVALLGLAVAFGIVAAVVAFSLAIIAAVPAAIAAVAGTLGALVVHLTNLFAETNFRTLGLNMVNGIVAGVTSGMTRLRTAVTNLAGNAREAFRNALGIASPSRVFAEYGVNISEGVAQGVDSSAPLAEDAVSNLVDAPAGGGLGGATSVSIGDVNINAGETSSPRELAIAFRDSLAEVLEGVSIEVGAT